MSPTLPSIAVPGSAGAKGKEGDSDVPDKPSEKEPSQQTQCLNSFYDSSLGDIVKFFSILNAFATPSKGFSWGGLLEWTLFPATKAAALEALSSLSKVVGSADFLSVTGASASEVIIGEFAALTKAIEAATGPGLLVVPFATAMDAGVRQMCRDVPGLRFGN